ncbi:cytidylate kinase-like family protein [Clostridium sp. MSJ-8]|uniref:cytidylate kinase-like family protein n=1 Tax=Clostridium sp. MSJ-8 TaxID=2841510 RepID=UPI001C0ED6CD|nr:cytidylate kinase-like family protein [Clostridium sp. MSJ-8]MBU5488282.1 cytidylate kinase-like family protein [Clostridium sp. MSJ-8]
MKHMVITIGCEYGSGGPEIGKMIADTLGIEYYDRDLVDKVVDQIGVERDLVEKADTENNVMYRFETKLGPRYANLTNRVIYNQFEVIRKLANKKSCVMIGRCSDYILQDRNDCLNIFIYAPEEIRLKSVMEKENLSKKQALEVLKYNDEMLHSRYKYITGTYRGDRKNRDMMIDSSVLGWEKTAKYILQLIELRFAE